MQINGIKTTGIIRCDQQRVIDLDARNANKIDRVPESIMDEVLAKLVPIFERVESVLHNHIVLRTRAAGLHPAYHFLLSKNSSNSASGKGRLNRYP